MNFPYPKSFDDFEDARRNGFVLAHDIKQRGGLIAGIFCTFTPEEIPEAAGIYTVSLCGMSEETIVDAEAHLPKNLCPLVKSSYGFAISQKCPYTYFADIIIGETTCDGKKKMYELLGKIKDTYILHLPQGTDHAYALPMWTEELRGLIAYLERRFDVKITDENLRIASQKRNDWRRAKLELMQMQRLVPPPMRGRDLYSVTEGSHFGFDISVTTQAILELTRSIREDYEAGKRVIAPDAKRILITGCPIGGVIDKTVGVIENNGGVVVCFENCGGIKPVCSMVDTEAEDIVQAIAARYLEIGCAVMMPNTRRLNHLEELIREYKVDGVIEIVLQACHPYSIEREQVKQLCRKNGTPYMALETDYSRSDVGQLTTRICAFLEML